LAVAAGAIKKNIFPVHVAVFGSPDHPAAAGALLTKIIFLSLQVLHIQSWLDLAVRLEQIILTLVQEATVLLLTTPHYVLRAAAAVGAVLET
jgi:hypothetical protein